jgi:hypothetical protein
MLMEDHYEIEPNALKEHYVIDSILYLIVYAQSDDVLYPY